MKNRAEKPSLVTILVLVTLILQVILSAGLLVRINQVYRLVVEDPSNIILEDVRASDVSVDDDPFIGPATAPITIVEFSSFSCSACQQVQEVLTQVKTVYGSRVRIVFRDFARGPGYPDFNAAMAAECADDQEAFWEMHDLLFEHSPVFDTGSLRSYAASLELDLEQFDRCIESRIHQAEIQHDVEDGRAYGVIATPTFFINGRQLTGAVPFSIFSRMIDAALQEH